MFGWADPLRADILDGVVRHPLAFVRRCAHWGGWVQPVLLTRRCARWNGWQRPPARLGVTSAATVAVLGVVGVVGGYLVPALAAQHPLAQRPVADNRQAPQPGVPGGEPGAVPGGNPAGQPTGKPAPSASASTAPATGPATLTGWAASLARVGISQTALQAYGYAEMVTTRATPGCHLTWTTLAGIGKIESNHGTHANSQLTPAGEAVPPIYGPALDGTNDNKMITDTDGGALDADKVYDRAVGPMQFLPGTWSRWGTDADGDGRADPQDINDAALSAARYLCADAHDLGTGTGWWQAIHSYNNLDKYASDVFAAADAYGIASRG